MNRAKKLMSLLLALVMMCSMMTTAFAAMEGTLDGGSITITNAIVDQTYDAYQILYLESYNAQSGAYAYKANSAWAEWLAEQTAYVSIDGQGYVTWVATDDSDSAAAAFAKLAKAYIESANLTVDASEVAEDTTVVIDGLKLGYYLVDTTTGALCSLDTTNPDVEMQEKNEVPTIEKEVQEDSTGKFGETNDADINQTVNYKATITVQAGAENYVVHDKMSAGLTYTGVTSVTVDGVAVDTANYTVTAPGTTCDDGCTFEIVFDNEYIATVIGKTIVIEYSATLNENAVVGVKGNPNDIRLEYGDENKPSYTPWDETITYTWDMDVLKYANGDKTAVLSGAKFVLLNNDKTKVAQITDGKLTGWVSITADMDLTAYALTTDDNGKIEIDGLDADTYYLREIEAPKGYNKLSEDITVVVTGATTSESGEVTYSTVVAEVENKSGTELPSTGGMGTTMLYVGGGALIVLAVAMLVLKKRKA